MRNLFFMLATCCFITTVAADKSFSSDKGNTQREIIRAFSQKRVLNASEVSRLIINKTINVLSEKTDKKTEEHLKYKAYFSDLGAVLVVFKSGARETRTWSVKADVALCIRRAVGRHKRGASCGYIISSGRGVYKMYQVKHVYEKKSRVVGGRHIKQLVTFSNFKKGNRL